MKRSFTAIIAASLISGSWAFQIEAPESGIDAAFKRLEAGTLRAGRDPETLMRLAAADNAGALAALTPELEAEAPWLHGYLSRAQAAAAGLVSQESAHFVLWTPPDQAFLGAYALPALEEAGAYFDRAFGRRPEGKIRVEVYPDKESFSAASTLSEETLERSGAIGICKFHRLMILSPRALPMGYRWLDALTHEYVHLMVNELSETNAELWLHEGTARYFETAPRKNPPRYLTAHQKTALIEAREKGELVPFERMSPSMVYLKDQEQVSLAFAQVSHAVDLLVRERGLKGYSRFLKRLSDAPFETAFRKVFGMTPPEFEARWKEALAKEPWEKSRGAMSDEIRFVALSEDEAIGADARARVRFGDLMRARGQVEPALMEYEKALVEEPDNAVILLKAARSLLSLGRTDDARRKLRRAVEKNPNYGTPWIELAGLVEPAEAVSCLLEANAINPFDPRIHAMLSGAFAKLGEGEKAEREDAVARLLKGG